MMAVLHSCCVDYSQGIDGFGGRREGLRAPGVI